MGGPNTTVQSIDVNEDGKKDLVYTSNDNTVSVALGKGDGTFQTSKTFATEGNASSGVAVGDFNGDGIEDIAVHTFSGSDVLVEPGSIEILLGRGDGTFNSGGVFAVGKYGGPVATADLDHDGYLDLISADGNDLTLNILKGNGDGTFQARITLSTSTEFGAIPRAPIETGDFNQDGNLDILLPEGTIKFGDGHMNFSSLNLSAGFTITEAHLGDFNRDGKLDVLAQDGLGNYQTLLGNGNGTFSQQSVFSGGIYGFAQTVSDFNSDGILDFATQNATGTVGIAIFTGNGDGTFTKSGVAAQPVNGYPVAIFGHDYNGDGVADLFETSPAGFYLSLGIGEVRSASSKIDVSSSDAAQTLIRLADSARDKILENRSSISAIHSRLQSIVNLNEGQVGVLAAAKSSVLDADFAEETANLVRDQILQQAQVAALTQSNLQSRLVAELLRY